MSWFSKDGNVEALAEEYGQLSRHAAKLQAELDAALAELEYAKSGNTDTVMLQRDRDFWRAEAARLSVESKWELKYVQTVGTAVKAREAAIDKLLADARADAFRRGWLHGLDDLEDILGYAVLEDRRERAANYDLDDCGTLCADPAAQDDDDIPF